jgi:hypothetical protein
MCSWVRFYDCQFCEVGMHNFEAKERERGLKKQRKFHKAWSLSLQRKRR